MPLTRPLVKRGRSVALTVPAPIAQLLDWNVGTVVELEPTNTGIIVRTAKPSAPPSP